MALAVKSVFFLQLQTKIYALGTEDEPQLQNILPHTNKIKQNKNTYPLKKMLPSACSEETDNIIIITALLRMVVHLYISGAVDLFRCQLGSLEKWWERVEQAYKYIYDVPVASLHAQETK